MTALERTALALVDAVLARPRRGLAWTAGLSAVVLLGVPHLTLRTDGAAIHPRSDPVVRQGLLDRRDFGEGDAVIVLVTARVGRPDLTTRAGLRTLRALHQDLAEAPGVYTRRARSLANQWDPDPDTSLMSLPFVLDSIPVADVEFDSLLARIARLPLAHGLYLSPDGRAAALYLPALRGADRLRLIGAVEDRAAVWRSDEFDIRLIGPVVAEGLLGRVVLRDLARLVPIMLFVVIAMLYIALRSPGSVTVATIKIGTVIATTLGVMGLAGAPITLVTTVLPVVVLTMAVTDEIHVLGRFQHRLSGAPDRAVAFRRAMHDVALPVMLTSFTTALGFLSFLSSPIPPLRDFGLYAALGITLALVATLTLVPALVMILPGSWFSDRGASRPSRPAVAAPWAAVVVLLVAGAAGPGLARLEVQDSWIDNFDPESEIVRADRDYNARFWGTGRFDVVLETDDLAFFQFEKGLRILDRVAPALASAPGVRGVVTPLLAYEFLARQENLRGPIRDMDHETVRYLAGVLHSIQAWIDLDYLLLGNGKAARVRAFVPNPDFVKTRRIEEHLRTVLPPILEGTDVRFRFGGDMPVSAAVVRGIVANMMVSVGWTLAGVTLLLVLAFRSLRTAAVCVLPLAVGIATLLGVLGYASVPLGVATSMFAAITIGVGVDLGIHYTHAYQSARARGLPPGKAVAETDRTVRGPVRWNVVVLSLGLAVLSFSSLKPNRSLGLLLVGALVAVYLATTLLFPLMSRAIPVQQRSR